VLTVSHISIAPRESQMNTYYRAVALYQDAEIAEGSGTTRRDAIADACEQISSIYPREDVRFEIYPERM
jgi:hypothetical protein